MLVRVCSRLGNQQFMYAFGRGLEARTNNKVEFFWKDNQNQYALRPYVDVALCNPPEWYVPRFKESKFTFDPDVYKQQDLTWFDGVWQFEKYFQHIADDIRKELTLKSVSLRVQDKADLLRSSNSVFIH